MRRGGIAVLAFVAAFPALADNALPSAVRTRANDAGVFYETAAGHTLYTYDKDTPAASACIGECEKTWPPLLAAESDQAAGAWTLINRAGGARQWAYKGKPLYTYVRDTAPGVALGGGLQDVWHVAVDLTPRPQTVVYQSTITGRVAATAQGHTLYVSKKDCTAKCLELRQPLRAAWTANAIGEWSVAVRADDATKQWAYRGMPVYTYVGDLMPGEINGADQSWSAVVLHPPAAVPSWVTVQVSDHGPIFADAKGLTLYAINTNMDELKRLYCDDACMADHWSPMAANDSDKPLGNWTVAKGLWGLQWHYRGEPVFTYKSDRGPSDITGDRFAVGNGFGGFHVLPQRSLIEETL